VTIRKKKKKPIEWTDRRWNPVRGCSMAPGSELGGCLYCYAARIAARNLPAMRSPATGAPFAILTDNGPRWTGDVELIQAKLDEPRHWKRACKCFVNSMSDLFHEHLPFWAIDDVFDAMLPSPQHYYQILTKRGRRMFEYFDSSSNRSDYLHKLPRLALGVSVENPKTAGMRLPWLLPIPAPYRMVSYEPALEWIDFEAVPIGGGTFNALARPGLYRNHHIDWLIVGGESGCHARPFHLEWARKLIKICARYPGVALFLKQLGARPVCGNSGDLFELIKIVDPKGADPNEWPPDLQNVRAFPYLGA
jgi:protein gp37